ncbi:MAG: hypothetical protein ACOYD5_12480 [Negativicutes bacterium]|jgi:maleate isomerase
MFEKYIPKKLIGSLYPHPQIDTGFYDFYQLVPSGIMMVAVSVDLREFTKEDVERALAPLDEYLELLMERQVDIILQTGVPPVVLTGIEFHDKVLEYITEKTQKPAVSTINCVIQAVKHLGLKKIVAANKWTDKMNETLKQFFLRDEIEMVGFHNEALAMNVFMKSSVEESARLAYELGMEALRKYPEAEGLYVGGGAWLSVPIVDALEKEFNKPVITNTTAQAWHLLNCLNMWESIPGRGILLGS